MSLYVDWLNQIKLRSNADWLTDAQRSAYDSLLKRWKASTFVCLSGEPGSGKSFIARLLTKAEGFTYVTSLRDAPQGAQVIVDGEDYMRRMRPVAYLLGLSRVIVVMRRPPIDPMPIADVVLTTRDVFQFQHNLTKHGILASFRTVATGTDLGEILRAEAIARGDSDGT